MRLWWRLIAVVGLLIGLSVPLFADDIKFQQIYVDDGVLFLSIRSAVSGSINLRRFIEDGMELTVTYKINLYRDHPGILLPDVLITNISIVYSTEYDFINKGYRVKRTTSSGESSLWYRSVDDVYNRIIDITDFPICTLSDLKAGQKDSADYYFEVVGDFKSLELYPPLSIIYNLLGKWNYTTPKTKSRTFKADEDLLE